MKVANQSLSDHYTWGANCDGWRLVDTPEISVIEEEMPRHTAEHTHYHAQASQVFYVLVGQLSITLKGESFSLKPGDTLHIPPGTVHTVHNAGETAARFLVVSCPSSSGDRVNVKEDEQ